MKIALLFGFGIFLVGTGLYWRLLDDIIESYIKPFALRNDYWYASDLVWHAIPFILIIVGIFCLIVGALAARQRQVVSE